ncbi:MAG TPA: hypothetical protein VD839_02175 [Burkholderiales bacterium]|nr:hypothetical protein [Burkholderiales bacterium]
MAIVIVFLLSASPAFAVVTCDQLVAISQRAISARDEGVSLARVLADTESAELKQRYSPTELDFIRLLIRESFLGAYSPYDVKDACEDGRLAIPVQKSEKKGK